MEHLRCPERNERLEPARQSLRALLHQDDFPVPHPEGEDVAVVANVEEELSGALVGLAAQVRQHIEAVEMDLEGLVSRLVAVPKLGCDIRLSRRGEESRHPVLVADDAVNDRARLE